MKIFVDHVPEITRLLQPAGRSPLSPPGRLRWRHGVALRLPRRRVLFVLR